MSLEISTRESTLAKAAILFCQKTHTTFPGAVIELIEQHYSDEDLTLEVQVPADVDVRQASDALLRVALDVEDQYGVTILTRAVRGKGVE